MFMIHCLNDLTLLCLSLGWETPRIRANTTPGPLQNEPKLSTNVTVCRGKIKKQIFKFYTQVCLVFWLPPIYPTVNICPGGCGTNRLTTLGFYRFPPHNISLLDICPFITTDPTMAKMGGRFNRGTVANWPMACQRTGSLLRC